MKAGKKRPLKRCLISISEEAHRVGKVFCAQQDIRLIKWMSEICEKAILEEVRKDA